MRKVIILFLELCAFYMDSSNLISAKNAVNDTGQFCSHLCSKTLNSKET